MYEAMKEVGTIIFTCTVGVLIFILVSIMLFGLLLDDKTPTDYYMGTLRQSNTCVYAKQAWAEDPAVYCGEIGEAITVLQALKLTMQRPTSKQEQ